MKSVADIKRAMVLGSKWKAFHHPFSKDMGIREIGKVMSNQVAFKTETGSLSYIDFPKKKDVVFNSPDSFTIFYTDDVNRGKPEAVLTYERVI